MTVLVVASSEEQYENYLTENGFSKDEFKYILGIDDILGYDWKTIEIVVLDVSAPIMNNRYFVGMLRYVREERA
jgi:hypothetical protein